MLASSFFYALFLVATVLLSVSRGTYVIKSQAPECIELFSDCSELGFDYRLFSHSKTEYVTDTSFSRSPASQMLRLHFAVRQANPELLSETLNAVSDPSSNRYGKYLTRQQVQAAHTDFEAAAAVEHFVTPFVNNCTSGNSTVINSGDFVSVYLSVRAAEAMLATEFHSFRSDSTGRIIHRSFAYSLPVELIELVDFVSAVTRFPQVRAPLISFDADRGFVLPSIINKVYNITSNIVTNPKATQSVFESLGGSFSNLDLQQFFKTFGIPTQGVARIVGFNNPDLCFPNPNLCLESMLDLEYMMSVAQQAPTTYWSMSSNDDFAQFLVDVSADEHPPLVISISYMEPETPYHLPEAGRFNIEAQKLGLRGVTIVAAAGDDGVASPIARNNASACGFLPQFPASSPFVVAVGATQGPESGQSEFACSSMTDCGITTGGGFSQFFLTPLYQRNVVQAYLSSSGVTIPPTNLFSVSGRAYPDVTALGVRYRIVVGGQLTIASGSSASAPVFAAMLTLINSKRMDAGKSPLGFVNPALYAVYASVSSAFNDITQGQNNCCASLGQPVCCKYGFYASKGFDPVSGLGSPNFPILLDALLKL